MLVGLEVHRLIDSKKLFCDCTYKKIKKGIEKKIYYSSCEKNFTYNTSEDYCDYEIDQIPAKLNETIMKKAIKIVKNIPGIKMVPKIVFCRKRIMDNSLPSGYQITGLLGYDGFIELDDKIVKIERVYLEQDSCAISEGLYKVDRLGLPLIEVSTGKTNLSGEEVKKLLRKIEFYLNYNRNLPINSFCRRQDLNVSIPGHDRVELKGVSTLSEIPKILENQVKRQKESLQKGFSKGSTRKIDNTFSIFLREVSTKDRMILETEVEPYEIRSFKRKIFSFYQKFDEDLDDYLKNNKILKRFQKLNKKYELKISDINLVKRAVNNKNFNFSRFESYLKGQISEISFRQNLNIKTATPLELERLSKTLERKEFLRLYKVKFPRNYIPFR